jgi:RiboL-PSP-HEPN
MPSVALLYWQNDRMPRLTQIDVQCAVSAAAAPPNAYLIEENLRGYVVLLSAHFQGFCRDLYTEAAQLIAFRVPQRLRTLILAQFVSHRALDRGNPNIDNMAMDFGRLDFDLRVKINTDPVNAPRRQHLAALNQWRNVAAHQGTTLPTSGPLSLPTLQTWRASCSGLATSLDAIVYNELRVILGRKPW